MAEYKRERQELDSHKDNKRQRGAYDVLFPELVFPELFDCQEGIPMPDLSDESDLPEVPELVFLEELLATLPPITQQKPINKPKHTKKTKKTACKPTPIKTDNTLVVCNSDDNNTIYMLTTDPATSKAFRAAFAETYRNDIDTHIKMTWVFDGAEEQAKTYTPAFPYVWTAKIAAENPLLKFIPDLESRRWTIQRLMYGQNLDSFGQTWNLPCYDWKFAD